MNALESAKPKMQPGDKFKPSDQSLQTVMIVPRYTTSMNSPKRAPGQASGAGEDTDLQGWQDQPERRHRIPERLQAQY